MLRRLLLGWLKGALVGTVLALAVVYGLGMPVFAAWAAYAFAVAAGVLTGLVSGKPIWAKDARIEAGLKAAAGALIGAGAMFAIRKWLNVNLDFGQLGRGAVGQLPLASLPMISTLLALFYELDNTGDTSAASTKTRVQGDEATPPAVREELELEEQEAIEEEAARKATKH